MKHKLLLGSILLLAFGFFYIASDFNSDCERDKVNFEQAIRYKNAVMSKNQTRVDSLNKVMNKDTKMVGIIFVQHSLGLIDVKEENKQLDYILNN